MRRVAEVVGIAQPVEVGLRKRALESGIRDRAAKVVSECAVIICVTAAGQVPRSTERGRCNAWSRKSLRGDNY